MTDTGYEGLADPDGHHSNCGVGVVMDLDGGGGHGVVADALELLGNLEHRGATGAEADTGDGAGILLGTPRAFFESVVGADLPDRYAVGSVFLPPDDEARRAVEALVEDALAERGLDPFHWRTVPTDGTVLGRGAAESEPAVRQCFVRPAEEGDSGDSTSELPDETFDRRLYEARRVVEKRVADERPAGHDRFYVCSLSRDTVVYKGLLTANQLPAYYPDLLDERVASTFAVVHARFSTNTLGAWHLAHPFRTLVHNGEFNTLRGNVNWLRAREPDLGSDGDVGDGDFGDAGDHGSDGPGGDSFGSDDDLGSDDSPGDDSDDEHLDLDAVRPVVADPEGSDSAAVDDTLELLLRGGRSLPHALRMMIPEAWRGDDAMAEERRNWYDFHASLLEPWDGPALVVATDGERVGAVLDRNGLRPCRYDVTTDGRLVLSSEVGALDVPASEVAERDRLAPGQLLLAEPGEGVVADSAAFGDLTDARYGEWVDRQQVPLSDLVDETGNQPTAPGRPPDLGATERRALQVAHGYTRDELDELLAPMATAGVDPVGSMGDDTPPAVLSEFDRPLYSYFNQRFAQVTNPPLDYVREDLVTSLEVRLGRQRDLLGESPAHARQVVADSPVLSGPEAAVLRGLDRGDLSSAVVDATFDPATSVEAAVERLRADARAAAEAGHDVVVVSDRAVGPDRLPIPALLATAAVHHHLVRAGLRARVGLVVESGSPRTVHHLAALVGYGAGAVYPSLAYRSVAAAVDDGDAPGDEGDAIGAYRTATADGLLRTMAKMGISTVESYRGAQVFETVGLDSEFVAEYFAGTPNRTEGVGLDAVEATVRARHAAAYGATADGGEGETNTDGATVERVGEFEYRTDGIHHRWNPETVGSLQRAVRAEDFEEYRRFAAMHTDREETLASLRALLSVGNDREAVPVAAVEPVESIVRRFSTAPMSLGSLSPEMHETNAVATNRLGAKANTGEGGEPPERFGTDRECAVKQVASGRFGVTAGYLAAADEVQIKMAQGSKPGEGGHLPGHKVNETIADVRCATPGVGLISPPPQHDIYSIEDLKQLIYDLRAASGGADVGVKLVAEAGVGVVAAGVAKAGADAVHVSGRSGGTGASPRTSIKHAGVPWELGLAEANQLLRREGLRSAVRLSVDGGLSTGRDVAVAALLGAEEFVFGTASLVSGGCVMARQCHTNNCPVGVATQKEALRDRFPGEPDHVVTYLTFVARELRETMADLGVRTVEELVGRVDWLSRRDVDHPTAGTVDLSAVLAEPSGGERTWAGGVAAGRATGGEGSSADAGGGSPTGDGAPSDDAPEDRFAAGVPADHPDRRLLADLAPAIEDGDPTTADLAVCNRDRAVGALASAAVCDRHGPDGLPDGTATVRARGTAGVSFGAFLAPGVALDLTGAANDYLGKGLSGGRVVVRAPDDAGYDPERALAAGNVALYGATGGEAYLRGRAGERFAVRNSGAMAVVGGVGDHGCEYMTGGGVVVLGPVGRNFAAGMTGGVAYVLDGENLTERTNGETVSLVRDLGERDERLLGRLVENHAAYADSERARRLLDDWAAARRRFVAVVPDAYRRAVDEDGRSDVRASPPPAAGSAGAGVVADD